MIPAVSNAAQKNYLSSIYTIQPVVKPVWQPVVSCIQPVVKPVVQPGLTTGSGWTNSGCSFNTVVKPVVNGCTTRFDNWLYRVNGVLIFNILLRFQLVMECKRLLAYDLYITPVGGWNMLGAKLLKFQQQWLPSTAFLIVENSSALLLRLIRFAQKLELRWTVRLQTLPYHDLCEVTRTDRGSRAIPQNFKFLKIQGGGRLYNTLNCGGALLENSSP